VGQGISAAEHRDVAEVQGDRLDADHQLAALRPRIALLPHPKVVQAREVVEAVCLHRMDLRGTGTGAIAAR